MDPKATYIPALRFSFLTSLYDPLMRAALKEEKFKRRLVEQASIRPSQRVLDLGCGTATLTLLVKQAAPAADVVGLDGDPAVLRIAREKAEQAGVEITLLEGMSFAPPFPPESFDCILSSLVLHHLTTADKRRTLEQAYQLLKPGGTLHIADWGQAQNALMRVAFLGVQLLDGFETTADNVAGRLIPLMREAGFADAEETHHEMTVFGTLALYRASRQA